MRFVSTDRPFCRPRGTPSDGNLGFFVGQDFETAYRVGCLGVTEAKQPSLRVFGPNRVLSVLAFV